MTREEAIKWIDDRMCYGRGTFTINHPPNFDECWEAGRMAIEALKNEPIPCEKCIHVKSCRKVIILKNRTYKLVKYCSQGVKRKEL